MGNKDARSREVKKPKKKTPKLVAPKRDVHAATTTIEKKSTP